MPRQLLLIVSAGLAALTLPAATIAQQVDERPQRSATDDPAAMGRFPDGWSTARPALADGPGVARMPPEESELGEFKEQYEDHKVLFAPTIEKSLAPGAAETIEIPVAGRAGLSASVRWIATAVNPVTVALALDGSRLATTGTPYHFGTNRGGLLLKASTASGGRATITVTNTSNAGVKVRIVFAATPV